MSNQTDHTIVRLRVPPELKQKIEESAEKNNRSQSAEMVARLEESFKESDDPKTLESLAKIVKETTEETTRLHKELVKIIEQQKIEIENLKQG
ncbi:Arc family DNA-binding protein [Acinetobacter sp. YH12063]|uniref:Arc family DNA-binding protein n=1 Tax=Acinetobacter sp. YH12063 TaxID=2601061 RepID=UPI0015D16ADC|nr:Arc family DNA-binding protein [Acinetobacter sp. YH12063]